MCQNLVGVYVCLARYNVSKRNWHVGHSLKSEFVTDRSFSVCLSEMCSLIFKIMQ